MIVGNTTGVVACEAAYRHGEDWADAMIDYVRGNQAHFAGRLADLDLPMRALPMESLYLGWIDARPLGLTSSQLHDRLVRKARIWLDTGAKYGPGGEGFARINLGCPRSRVDLALERIGQAFK